MIAKINDPLRAAAYADLGINTLCRTNLMATAVNDFLGLDLAFGPGLSEATGIHPGGEHHVDASEMPAPSGGGSAPGSPGSPGGGGSTPMAGTAGASFASIQAPAAPVAAREG